MAKRPTEVPEVYRQEAREHIRMFARNMRSNPLVLEIGCNDGMHTRIFLDEIPDIRMVCFEPDPRPIPRFMDAAGRDPRVFFQNYAVADKTGMLPWFASGGTTKNSWLDDWDLSGSIRKPTGHLQLSPWVTFKETDKVAAVALDDWVHDHSSAYPGPIDLIFADVQGAEADMIRGGEKTFREQVRYLWTEYYDQPMYEGQPNLQEILALLPGYEVVTQYKQDAYLRNTRLA